MKSNRLLNYRLMPTEYGQMLIAKTNRGLTALAFADTDAELESWLHEVRSGFNNERDDAALKLLGDHLLELMANPRLPTKFPLDLMGTQFQRDVWNALLKIPCGETRTYSEVAEAVGRPKAVRAVASACGKNAVALIVPCHRVIGTDGNLHGYRWGLERKLAMLEKEEVAVIPRASLR
jgi:AraC family transcriptional regulator of adaptative response/methylated-DNA-[protein]-cysteine methyltransferase